MFDSDTDRLVSGDDAFAERLATREAESEDAPATEESEETETEDQQPEEGTDPESAEETPDEESAEEEDTEDAPDRVEQLIQQFAKETGLNPNDPGQRKTLKRLADKEAFIEQQKATIKDLESKVSKPDEDALTEFERKLFKDDEPKKDEEAKPIADSRDEPVLPQWDTPEQAYKAQVVAWEKMQQGDFSAIADVDNRMFGLRLQGSEPYLKQAFANFLEETIGPILPDMHQAVSERRGQQALNTAVAEVSKQKGYEDVKSLYTPVSDEPLITPDGTELQNTPINRVLQENPEIRDIRVTHTPSGKPLSPQDALTATRMAQLRVAYRAWKRSSSDAKTIEKAFTAGKKANKRDQSDKVRQGLNSGPGARKQTEKQTLGQELLRASRGDQESLSDLFK